MPRVHFVKKARKANKALGIKKGESYYWWAFRYGGKRVSKVSPRPSQLTQSEFLSTVYSCQERIEDLKWDDSKTLQENIDDAKSEVEDVVSELQSQADECEDKRSNMPDQLQDAPTGELLGERADNVRSYADELEGVDLDVETKEDFESALDELQGCEYQGE